MESKSAFHLLELAGRTGQSVNRIGHFEWMVLQKNNNLVTPKLPPVTNSNKYNIAMSNRICERLTAGKVSNVIMQQRSAFTPGPQHINRLLDSDSPGY